MTVKKKATIFIILYILIGIAGMICFGDTLRAPRQKQAKEALEGDVPASLRLIDTHERNESVMVFCRDRENAFYQYPIIRENSAHCPASNIPENITWLKLSKRPRHMYHRKNRGVLQMSMIVESKDSLPVITDNLGSEFKIRTKEFDTGETILYIRRIFKEAIPENYVLWIDGQEITFH